MANMTIDIDIQGAHAIGKTTLARKLRVFLAEQLIAPQDAVVTIRTRNAAHGRWEIEA